MGVASRDGLAWRDLTRFVTVERLGLARSVILGWFGEIWFCANWFVALGWVWWGQVSRIGMAWHGE